MICTHHGAVICICRHTCNETFFEFVIKWFSFLKLEASFLKHFQSINFSHFLKCEVIMMLHVNRHLKPCNFVTPSDEQQFLFEKRKNLYFHFLKFK